MNVQLVGQGSLQTQPKFHINGGRSTLEDTKGLDNRRGHAVLGLVDLEVLQGALRLRSPVLVGGHLDLAKSIALCPCRSHLGRGCELAALRGVLRLQLRVARGCGESTPGLSRPISGHDGRAGFCMCQSRAQARLGCAGLQRSSEHCDGRRRCDDGR